MIDKIKIEKLSEIIPLFNGKRTLTQIGEMLEPKRSQATMSRWVRRLKEEGYTINIVKRGRKKLKV